MTLNLVANTPRRPSVPLDVALPDCTCGLAKIEKHGTYIWDGHEVCNRCKRPLAVGDRGQVMPSRTVDTTVPMEPTPSFGREKVTTLGTLPGFHIERSLGVVTSVSSNAGWTATSKGADALERAMFELIRQASELGGTAIVGLRASAFGAHGGITNALGGDAVGLVLLGTVVVARPSISDAAGLLGPESV